MEAFNTALDFGTFALPWNAVMLVLAVVAAILVSGAIVRQRGLYRDLALDICILCIPVGLLGARLFAVFSGKIAWKAFLSFGDLGLNLFGALLFCAIGIWVYCRIKKFDFGETLDVLMPGMLFAVAIGRWQDFFLCDGLGYPVENPVLKFFPLATFAPSYFSDGVSVAYVVFFWEFLLDLALGIFVWRFLLRRNLKNGDSAALTLLAFGCIAYWMECLRDPVSRQIIFLDLPYNGLCAGLLALGAFLYLLVRKCFPGIRVGLRQLRNMPPVPEAKSDSQPQTDFRKDQP